MNGVAPEDGGTTTANRTGQTDTVRGGSPLATNVPQIRTGHADTARGKHPVCLTRSIYRICTPDRHWNYCQGGHRIYVNGVGDYG